MTGTQNCRIVPQTARRIRLLSPWFTIPLRIANIPEISKVALSRALERYPSPREIGSQPRLKALLNGA